MIFFVALQRCDSKRVDDRIIILFKKVRRAIFSSHVTLDNSSLPNAAYNTQARSQHTVYIRSMIKLKRIFSAYTERSALDFGSVAAHASFS